MGRLSRLVAALLIVMVACGGDGSNGGDDAADPATTTQAPTTQPADDGAATTQPVEDDAPTTEAPPADEGGASEGTGPSTATVTLDGETYLFSSEGAVVAQCLTDLFGTFSVQLTRVDESGAPIDGSVQIFILHEGTDPDEVGQVNAVKVDIGDDTWVADESDPMLEQSEVLEPGMSQVDTAEIDGRTVRGTATFYESISVFTGELKTATGSFEATCGEERTS